MIIGLPLLFQLVPFCLYMVGDDRFDDGLCATVGVCRANRAMLRNRYHIREASCVTIDSGRGRENDVGDIMSGHGTEQTDGAVDIGSVVLERNFA